MVCEETSAAETGKEIPAQKAEGVIVWRRAIAGERERSGILIQFPDDVASLVADVARWIKVDHDTLSKPETLSMARELNVSVYEILGRCVAVWCWADISTEDGFIAGATLADLDRVAGLPGLGAMMARCGWVAECAVDGPIAACGKAGGILFINFLSHNGRSAKRRAMQARRASMFRNNRGNYK
jgi:hypothetical protein